MNEDYSDAAGPGADSSYPAARIGYNAGWKPNAGIDLTQAFQLLPSLESAEEGMAAD